MKVKIITNDGHEFLATLDADEPGVAWVDGNAWVDPALGYVPGTAVNDSRSWEIASTFALQ